MAKITEYPEAQSFDAGDVILKDGTNGTKKMTAETLKSLIAPVDTTLSQTGKAADAKAVGDAAKALESTVNGIGDVALSGEEVNLSQYASTGAFISTSSGKWITGSGDECWIAPIYENIKFVSVTANSSQPAMVAMLTTNSHTAGTDPDYVTGESVTVIEAGATKFIKVPSGCQYCYIAKANGGTNYAPASFKYETPAVPPVDNTLSHSGEAADAKTVGDNITAVKENSVKIETKTLETQMSCHPSSLWQAKTVEKEAERVIIKLEPRQSGEGDPSSTNIRTIYGHDKVSLYLGNGNLYNGRNEFHAYLDLTTGSPYTQVDYQITEFIDVSGISSLYVMWRNLTGENKTARYAFYDENRELVGSVKKLDSKSTVVRPGGTDPGSITVPDGAKYFRFACCLTDFLFILGERESLFASTSLPTQAGELNSPASVTGVVYGGYLDVINGKLVVTKACIDSYSGETLTGKWISSMDVYVNSETPPTLGAQVVYDLEQPVEFEFTPKTIKYRDGDTCLLAYDPGSNGYINGVIADYPDSGYLSSENIGETSYEKSVSSNINKISNLIHNGYTYSITSKDLIQNGYAKANGGIYGTDKRITLKEAIWLKEGTKITFPTNGKYYIAWGLKTPDLFAPEQLWSTGDWAKLTEYIVPVDSYVYISIATHQTAGASQVIVPSDFVGAIVFTEPNYIDDVKEALLNESDALYVVEESDRVSENVRNVQTGDSLTFVAVSDMHYNVDDTNVQRALKDMGDAVKQIKKQINIDFFASFGDITYRLSSNGNYAKGKAECIAATKILNGCFEDRDQIRAVGNHDTNAEGSTGYFTTNQLNAFAGIYSNMLTKDEEYSNLGVGYHDFERQKVRLIVLNTSYYEQGSSPAQGATTYSFSDKEAYLFCQMLDLSEKQDAGDWQIITLSHIQIDFNDTAAHANAIGKYSAVIDAYVNGTSWSSGSYSYDFSEKNSATFALYIHGHSHKYYVRNVMKVNSSGTILARLPIADFYIPNALPDRDYASMDGVTYTKTANTAESTAFQVITLDPVNKILYAHHYGAGIDIIVHYDSSSETSYATTLTEPVWASMVEDVATVSDGTVTPVASGNVIIYAKSETDNCIECWNFHSVA